MTSRYALFYAPRADTRLWQVGSSIIGYDAERGAARPFPGDLPCSTAEWREMTAEPRRYGLHGTLKAPFHLAEGASEEGLLAVARAFAASQPRFALPSLDVANIGRFVALVPSGPSARLDDLAAESVRTFEPFRAPLTPADRTRRLAARLSERQVRHLDLWGYPHVFEDFRFHMTLTGAVPVALREPVRARLAALCDGLADGLQVDAVAIFRQGEREGPFRVVARLPLGASNA